jgi:hypothetical protein
MKVGEFASRARASKLSKKAKFEAAFERARRELRLLDAAPPALSPSPTIGFAQRRQAERPVLSLTRQKQEPPSETT